MHKILLNVSLITYKEKLENKLNKTFFNEMVHHLSTSIEAHKNHRGEFRSIIERYWIDVGRNYLSREKFVLFFINSIINNSISFSR